MNPLSPPPDPESIPFPFLKTDLTAFLLTILTIPFLFLLTTAIKRDYKAFVSLGPGGTPSSPYGYLRIKFLGIFADKDRYTPAPVPVHFKQQTGRLGNLPLRTGNRPTVRGIAPHRQINQKASSESFAALRSALFALSDNYPTHLIQKTSCLEKHGPGLFAMDARHCTPHCAGEIVHAHPSDGSMHLTLHPADAAIVLRAGWGEKHPLGSGGWLQNFVPSGFIMVYAPRNERELEVVLGIVKAAVWWIGGVDLDGEEKGEVVEREKEWIISCPTEGGQTVLPI